MADNGAQREEAGTLPAAARRRRWAVWAMAGAILAGGLAVGLWWRPRPQPPLAVSMDQDDDVDEPISTRDPGYVGMQACAACHRERVAEFRKTNHFHACRLPEAGTMPRSFAPGHGKFATPDPSLRFEMTQAGGDFLLTAIQATAAGDQRTSSRIAFVYGAGGADEVYHTWHGDGLYELPVAWLHPQNRWGIEPFYRYLKGDHARETTPRCVECHNTWFEHIPGTPNQYRRDTILIGVTCERCHGPGREHVAFHQAHPEVDAAQNIVHPGRLARERQLDLCAQCHSNATKRRGPAFSYRPGEALAAHFRIIESKYPEKDHVANQVQYLRQSKCFQRDDRMTCTTCHNPHRSSSSPEARRGQRACLSCHDAAHCAEQQRLPAAVRGDCVGCHMPEHIKINVHFHTEDDLYVPPITRHEHRIAVYPFARDEVLLAWYRTQSDPRSRQEAARLQAELVKHWFDVAENFRRNYRFLAAIGASREAVRLDPGPATRARLRDAVAFQARFDDDMANAEHQVDDRRFTEAIDSLRKILERKPDSAFAHGLLGTCYAVTGQYPLAVEQLKEAARYDAEDPYGYAMLGWLAYLHGRYDDALEAYRRADEIEPYAAKINFHWGLALAKLGRFPDAVEHYRLVLTIDPRHTGACQALSQTLRELGQPAEALRFARRAARLTRFQDPDILLTLAEAYLDVGRPAEANDAAAKALDAVQASSPDIQAQIHARVQDFRARSKPASIRK